MKNLPENVFPYKKTKIYDESSIPGGLLKNHQTLPGVWGKIVILQGHLIYTIQGETLESVDLDPENFGVVEPEVLHSVKPIGQVKFYVEFYK